jgi:hypothetical protein
MTWKRLYITVEGQAEQAFAKEVLVPHLAQFSIDVKPRLVITNRKLGCRGGITDYRKIRSDLVMRLKEDAKPEARFTTMLDLYALPGEFPGWVQANACAAAIQKVAALESALHADLADTRFIPYIQLHEFEALLFCDLSELQNRISGSGQALANLARSVQHLSPEDINQGPTTAPSKRIINHVPIYEKTKVRVGAPAAAAIGLSKLRSKCPHFDAWIDRLESL